jgi:diaminopropionate ammonia-lyase
MLGAVGETVASGPWGPVRSLVRDVRARQPAAPDPAIRRFHQCLPDYQVSPLRRADSVAYRLGVAEVWVKDETSRLGLPAFKGLGASWATYRALERYAGGFAPWTELDGLAEQLDRLPPVTLIAATDGNHGRAVARVAQWLGLSAEIFVPQGTAVARIEAIEAEGASARVVAGGYDDAVAVARSLASRERLVIADVGANESAEDVIHGYSTMMDEIREQQIAATCTTVSVQMGCGSFAASVIRYLAAGPASGLPLIVGVEPGAAACVLDSLLEGTPRMLTEPQDSVMAGLNCGEPSASAWNTLTLGLGASVAVSDAPVGEALRLLHTEGIPAGESGAAGLAGLLAVRDSLPAESQRRLGLHPEARVLLFATEGVTDPALTARLLDAT